METIKQLVLCVCMVSIIVGVVRWIVPEGGLGKTARLMVSLSMLMVFLTPFTQGYRLTDLFDVSYETFEPYHSPSVVTKQMEQAAAEEINQLVKSIAEQVGIEASVLQVKTEMHEQLVYITEITVAVKGTVNQGQRLKEMILKEADTEVHVQVEERE